MGYRQELEYVYFVSLRTIELIVWLADGPTVFSTSVSIYLTLVGLCEVGDLIEYQ